MPPSCMDFVAKEQMLNQYPSGHCLFYTAVFGKSNSASRHLKNLWGHSILLIKISHSLKHLQKMFSYFRRFDETTSWEANKSSVVWYL